MHNLPSQIQKQKLNFRNNLLRSVNLLMSWMLRSLKTSVMFFSLLLLQLCDVISGTVQLEKNTAALSNVVTKIFDKNGTEIDNVYALKYDQEVWISFGEEFRDPNGKLSRTNTLYLFGTISKVNNMFHLGVCSNLLDHFMKKNLSIQYWFCNQKVYIPLECVLFCTIEYGTSTVNHQ